MGRVLVIEPDRTFAKCIKDELEKRSVEVLLVVNANEAITAADEFKPGVVVTELSLAGHSGTEFIYEFRTYADWTDVPLVIYSSMKIPETIENSNDWKQLNVSEYLYKPDDSLDQLANSLLYLLES